MTTKKEEGGVEKNRMREREKKLYPRDTYGEGDFGEAQKWGPQLII